MPSFHTERLLEYDIWHIYNLIINVEDYPNFVPWCVNSRVIERSDANIIADLLVKFGPITESYRSLIKITPPLIQDIDNSTDNEKSLICANVQVSMIDGPFRHLNTIWQMNSYAKVLNNSRDLITDNTTITNFSIDFAFKNSVLEKLSKIWFKTACELTMKAFIERARKVYSSDKQKFGL